MFSLYVLDVCTSNDGAPQTVIALSTWGGQRKAASPSCSHIATKLIRIALPPTQLGLLPCRRIHTRHHMPGVGARVPHGQLPSTHLATSAIERLQLLMSGRSTPLSHGWQHACIVCLHWPAALWCPGHN